MRNQSEIIRRVHSMSIRELLDLLVENPFFLTDAYYVNIGNAVRDRYAELKSDFLVYHTSLRN
jgi:flagellar assembly factor FliW